jgi:hypothetical protein
MCVHHSVRRRAIALYCNLEIWTHQLCLPVARSASAGESVLGTMKERL